MGRPTGIGPTDGVPETLSQSVRANNGYLELKALETGESMGVHSNTFGAKDSKKREVDREGVLS